MANDTASKSPFYTIRNAEEADLPGMLEIFNEQIATSTAILRDDPFDLDDRRKWMRETKAAGFPIFVAVPSEETEAQANDNSAVPSVLGFAYYGTYRPRAGYRFTVEITFYVHHSLRGRGIGSALMTTLLGHASNAGNVHLLIAAITADNTDSIRFHERFGFVDAGTVREAGYKFGKFYAVTFLQLILPSGGPSESN